MFQNVNCNWKQEDLLQIAVRYACIQYPGSTCHDILLLFGALIHAILELHGIPLSFCESLACLTPVLVHITLSKMTKMRIFSTFDGMRR